MNESMNESNLDMGGFPEQSKPPAALGQQGQRLTTHRMFIKGQYNIVLRIISKTPKNPLWCHVPTGFQMQENSALATTYTCRWVRRRSTVTSFLTRSKRRRLLGTMFSRIDKESCCTEASIAFILT